MDLTHTGRGPASDTVPLAVGYIGAYLGQQFRLGRAVRIFRYPERFARALDAADRPPDLVGFSNYLWNSRLSLRFASLIKRNWPATVTVFGGPNLPLAADERETYLRRCSEIDFYVAREGELAFAELVHALRDADWDPGGVHGTVASTYSIDPNGTLHHGPPVPRLRTLDDIPSPYLNGSMDEFLDGYLIPSVQTNRGCPFTCSFCLEGDKYYTRVNSFTVERVAAELEYIGARMAGPIAAKGRNELNITDSNFGMFQQDEDICKAIGSCVERYGWPNRVNVTTGKNRRDRVLASIKQARGTIQLSGAVQSLDENVLANVNRANIRTADLIAVARDAAENATRTYSDVILGLPGDSLDAHLNTVASLVDGGFGRINLFQFALLLGAQINNPEVRDEFGLRTAYRLIPRAYGRYSVFGTTIVCGEIDEVCVGSGTLSFDDYIACRVFDLCTTLFHNDAIFAATEASLRLLGVPVSAWLRQIWSGRWSGHLADIREDFVRATAGQLFDSVTEADRDLEVKIEDYLHGDVGNNVLYAARGRALQEAVSDLAATARAAAVHLVDDPRYVADGARAAAADLLRQAARFDLLSLSGLLESDHLEEHIDGWFDYDFGLILRDKSTTLDAARRDQAVRIRFSLSEPVRAEVETYRLRMGATSDGMGRALSRIRVDDLRRRACLAEPSLAHT